MQLARHRDAGGGRSEIDAVDNLGGTVRLLRRRLSRSLRRLTVTSSINPSAHPATRHLLTIGFDAKGLPISLFTVIDLDAKLSALSAV